MVRVFVLAFVAACTISFGASVVAGPPSWLYATSTEARLKAASMHRADKWSLGKLALAYANFAVLYLPARLSSLCVGALPGAVRVSSDPLAKRFTGAQPERTITARVAVVTRGAGLHLALCV